MDSKNNRPGQRFGRTYPEQSSAQAPYDKEL
jgi:hypothetical protein